MTDQNTAVPTDRHFTLRHPGLSIGWAELGPLAVSPDGCALHLRTSTPQLPTRDPHRAFARLGSASARSESNKVRLITNFHSDILRRC